MSSAFPDPGDPKQFDDDVMHGLMAAHASESVGATIARVEPRRAIVCSIGRGTMSLDDASGTSVPFGAGTSRWKARSRHCLASSAAPKLEPACAARIAG